MLDPLRRLGWTSGIIHARLQLEVAPTQFAEAIKLILTRVAYVHAFFMDGAWHWAWILKDVLCCFSHALKEVLLTACSLVFFFHGSRN